MEDHIGWTIMAIIEIIIAIVIIVPWNPGYDPKGDDPYRYCPREEDEW